MMHVASTLNVLHESCANSLRQVKSNVTLKLDADLLSEARVIAAEEGRSVSALPASHLEEMVQGRQA